MSKEEEVNLEIGKYFSWLRNPKHLWPFLIVVGAFIIRLYYFSIMKIQALWWDESEYLAAAKLWAFDVPYNINPQRPPLFQAISALIFELDLGETTIKLFLVAIPSALLVWAVYMLGREMYNEEVAKIAAIFTAVSWTFVFWSIRVQPDFISMTFQVLAVIFMWRFWKTGNNRLAIYSGIFVAIGFYFKVSALLVPMSFLVFMLIRERIQIFNKKGNYLFALSFLVTLVPYFIWSKLTFGTISAFKSGYSNAIINPTPFGWNNLDFFVKLTTNDIGSLKMLFDLFGQSPINTLFSSILFILFIAGVIIALKFILYIDVILKDKEKTFDPNIFSLIVLMVVSAFYIFYIRYTDDRWVFLWLPFIFLLSANALVILVRKMNLNNKNIAMLIIILLVGLVVYNQIGHANSLIELKKSSYYPVKEAGIWIKDNSDKSDKVLSISYTQTVYYSERNVSSYSEIKDKEEFNKYLIENKPRFLQVSIFEPHPDWINLWIQENSGRLKPVFASFTDAKKEQATLIVYEVNYI